ncbi:MAG: DUF1273 domain-containing protein [Lactobacillaceae bacterium]|jgi:uncharacterized phage-like protein YoqJ|nr:DUF1273 domain-containing protein [Lactobacillaceae bacterium]
MQRIWITGFRSAELGLFGNKDPKRDVLLFALTKLLTRRLDEGAEWLITGGQMGIEQLAIEAGLALKTTHPELKIAMMLPFKDFGANWNEANQAKLQQLKSQVDYAAATSSLAYQNPQQLKGYQEFMLTHTDLGVVFYDEQAPESKTRYTYEAMQARHAQNAYEYQLIDFDKLQEFANEYQEMHQEW